jgi:hypothetical protein
MSQDLTFIRNELKGFKEVDSPFDLKKGKYVKYITIKDGEEYFYTGGKYKRMGDNKVFLEAKPSSCILQIKDKMGNITYSTKIFTEDDKLETCNKDKEEYEKIIETQQRIIETMSEKIKNHSIVINEAYEKNKKYEEIIKKLMDERNR